MSEIKEFSPDIIDKIGYYVYRLVDPRNGQTFYVGKGKGNRVFQHVSGSIKYFENKDKKDDDQSDDPYKLQVIRDILDAHLEVIHIIQRWNLTEPQAFAVESALIDAFPGLANIQSGHGVEYGVCNAKALNDRLSAKVYEEPSDFGYLIIKVKWWRLNEMTNKVDATESRYEATRGCWRIRIPDLKKYPYVFSVTDGLVKEVYKVKEWHQVGERKEFTGEVAPKEIRDRFVEKRIPDYYAKKGMASPVLKSKNI